MAELPTKRVVPMPSIIFKPFAFSFFSSYIYPTHPPAPPPVIPAITLPFSLSSNYYYCLFTFKGATSVTGYFPDATWYDGSDGSVLQSSGNGGQYHTLQAPWDKIPYHFRGGYVIPTQQPDITTYQR